jgi:hypothetical protein
VVSRDSEVGRNCSRERKRVCLYCVDSLVDSLFAKFGYFLYILVAPAQSCGRSRPRPAPSIFRSPLISAILL